MGFFSFHIANATEYWPRTSHNVAKGTRWIRKAKDDRWSIEVWGQGTETIQGARVTTNPTASQWFRIKRWEDLDTRYILSYVRNYDGINVSLTAKYAVEHATNELSDIPTVPVKKSDQSDLLKGDDLGKFPLELTDESFR